MEGNGDGAPWDDGERGGGGGRGNGMENGGRDQGTRQRVSVGHGVCGVGMPGGGGMPGGIGVPRGRMLGVGVPVGGMPGLGVSGLHTGAPGAGFGSRARLCPRLLPALR